MAIKKTAIDVESCVSTVYPDYLLKIHQASQAVDAMLVHLTSAMPHSSCVVKEDKTDSQLQAIAASTHVTCRLFG